VSARRQDAGLHAALEARSAARVRAEAALSDALHKQARAARTAQLARAALEAQPAKTLEPPYAAASETSGAALARAAAHARMHGEQRGLLRASAKAAQEALLACTAESERASAELARALGHERALARACAEREGAEQRLHERREQALSDEASAATRQRSATRAPQH
jgi:hypothetical protein